MKRVATITITTIGVLGSAASIVGFFQNRSSEKVSAHQVQSANQRKSSYHFELGAYYHHRLFMPKDGAEAARNYLIAAELGDARAQNNLGILFQKGIGVKANHAEAERLYRLSAKHGNTEAKQNLKNLRENLTFEPKPTSSLKIAF